MFLLRTILILAAALAVSHANAQTTYRWIDKATGKVVFSDQPPPPGAQQVVTKGSEKRDDSTPVSYATKQAAEKYPVTLYTAASCIEECKQARDLLNKRGVPFAEKMISTKEEEADLAKRLGSSAGLPSVFVGSQSIRGIEPESWNNLLDLAGYPKTPAFGAKPSGAFAK